MLKLKAVEKSFGSDSASKLEVVRQLNLQINSGDFVALLGPSGCGKSTLLRLIAGLEPLSSGRIESQAKEIGYVFQEPHLLPWRNLSENIALPLELKKLAASEKKKAVESTLELVGLSDFAAAFPNQLSGGMKMRVSLARALVCKPDLLLLDEPFAALDEFTRTHLDEELRRIWMETGVTILFVTHSVSEAAFLANRQIVFSRRPAAVIFDETNTPGASEVALVPIRQRLRQEIERAQHS